MFRGWLPLEGSTKYSLNTVGLQMTYWFILSRVPDCTSRRDLYVIYEQTAYMHLIPNRRSFCKLMAFYFRGIQLSAFVGSCEMPRGRMHILASRAQLHHSMLSTPPPPVKPERRVIHFRFVFWIL